MVSPSRPTESRLLLVQSYEIMRDVKSVLAIMVVLLVSGQSRSQGTAIITVRKLAFEVTGGRFPFPKNDIFILDNPSSRPRHLAAGLHPVWSPDGQKVAYCVLKGIGTARVEKGSVQVIGADGSGRTQLADVDLGGCPTDWSPDGQRIALDTPGRIMIVGKNGGTATQVAIGYGAHWSPDGKKLVFCRNSPDNHPTGSIWIANADGSDARRVFADDSEVLEANWGTEGQSILFTSVRDHNRRAEIFRVKLDGSDLQIVAADKHLSLYFPILSPDGHALVADGIRSGEVNVVLIDLMSGRSSVLARGSHPSVLWEQK